MTHGTVLLRRTQLALHTTELAINSPQTSSGLNQNHPAHAIGDVLSHHGRRTVVHVQARFQSFESEAFGLTGRCLGNVGPTAGTSDRVEIDGVNMVRVFGVGHIDGDRVALTYPNKGAGYFVVERPIFVGCAVSEL